MRGACAALLLLLAAPAAVHAQSDTQESEVITAPRAVAIPIDTMVVTASRRMQRLKDAPVMTELISAREIRESAASNVAALLLEHTGIEMEPGVASGTGAMLQGFGSERVLILLDGQPLPGRVAGVFDLSRMPIASLERVEIVKGPMSTLFGSAAMGGVINLITRSPASQLNGSLDVLRGTEGRTDASARVEGRIAGVNALADVGMRSIALTPGTASQTGASTSQWDAVLKLERSIEAGKVEASALVVDERQQWRTGQLYTFADNRQVAMQASAVRMFGAHRLAPAISHSLFEHLSRRSSTDVPTGEGERDTQTLTEAELLWSAAAGAHTFDAGIEARRDAITSARVTGGRRSLDVMESFAQYTWNPGSFSIVPGVRFTNTEAWGSYWTPRVAMLYRPVEPLAVRASFGTGFRAPAFKELYMRFANVGPGFGYVVNGNPDLQPETSRNVTLGLEWARGAWYARSQVFSNQFSDFIETTIDGDSAGLEVYTYQNIQSGYTRGVEVESGVHWRALRLEAGYSFLATRDTATRSVLLGRPKHAGRVLVGHAAAFGLRSTLTATFTGETPVQRTESGTVMRTGFTRFDVRFSQSVLSRFELSFGVDNLLDATPQNWPGFTGRQMYAGVSVHSMTKP